MQPLSLHGCAQTDNDTGQVDVKIYYFMADTEAGILEHLDFSSSVDLYVMCLLRNVLSMVMILCNFNRPASLGLKADDRNQGVTHCAYRNITPLTNGTRTC